MRSMGGKNVPPDGDAWLSAQKLVQSCRNISQIFSLCGHFGQFYTFLSLPEVTQSRKSISLDIPSPCVRCSRKTYEAKDFPINTHGGLLAFGAPWEAPWTFLFFFVSSNAAQRLQFTIAEDVNLKPLSPLLHQVPAMYNIIEACRFEENFGEVDVGLGSGGAKDSLDSTVKGFRPSSLWALCLLVERYLTSGWCGLSGDLQSWAIERTQLHSQLQVGAGRQCSNPLYFEVNRFGAMLWGVKCHQCGGPWCSWVARHKDDSCHLN